jgi:anti-sigma B factor antagonist
MPEVRHLIKMVSGVPVVTLPAEIDATSADVLRAALLIAPRHGHATIVVDMTQTQLCDSSGLNMLVRAHQRAVAEGGELRLVIPDASMLGGVLPAIGPKHSRAGGRMRSRSGQDDARCAGYGLAVGRCRSDPWGMPRSGQRVRDRGNYGRPVAGSGRGWARPRSSLTHLTGRQYPGGTAMWGGSWPSSSPQCNSEWTQISAHLGQWAASGRG